MKYKKKPIQIEATQWFKNGDHPCDVSVLVYGASFEFKSEGLVVRRFRHPDISDDSECKHCGHIMKVHGWIDTLEGGHIVCPGDWIITGIDGEVYPCKDSIFQRTYDLIPDCCRIVTNSNEQQNLPDPE